MKNPFLKLYRVGKAIWRSVEYGARSIRDASLWGLLGVTKTTAGQSVNEDTSWMVSAYFCGRTIIDDAFKSLPLRLYERLEPRGKKKNTTHQAMRAFINGPNPDMTPSRFLRLVSFWASWGGNFCAEIERANNGRPLAFWPIHPSRVTKHREDNGRVYFKVRNDNGTHFEIEDEDMLHVFRHSKDGFWGVPDWEIMRESLGVSIAAEKFGARFFAGNAMPATVIITDENLDDEALKKFKRDWITEHGGDNAGGISVLGGGGNAPKIQQLGIPNQESQFQELRKFQVVEIARFLVISPFRLKDFDNATWGNASEESQYFASETVRPLALDFEDECDRKLLTPAERGVMFFEMDLAGLLRGDIKAQSEVLGNYVRMGLYSIDDAREKINENPLPNGEGDIYTREANLTPTAEIVARVNAIKDGTLGPDGKPVPVEPPPEDDPEPDDDDEDAEIDGQSERSSPDFNATFGPMFVAAGQRLGRIEADKAGRHSKKADTYLAWCEEFIGDHRERVRAELTPVVAGYLLAANRSADVFTVDKIIDEYMTGLAPALRTADPAVIAARPIDWVLTRLAPQEN